MAQESTFISEVCRQVIESHGNAMHEVTIVVPAKRSIRFFSNSFIGEFTRQKRASLLPEIITLTDLFDRLSPLSKLTQVELIFHFYEVYCKLESNPETFEQFFTWAPALLGDFNEIDNYLIDPKLLYNDLRNIKEQEIIIEGWSFERSQLSKGQTDLNEFWIKLPRYYKELKEYLIEHSIGYSGLINRLIATEPEKVFADHQDRVYVFAGFNALTKCEIEVLNYLVDHKKARVYFDADNYYVNNELHEAGLFLRNYKNTFNSPVQLIDANSIAKNKKSITYYESNGESLQCEEVVKILSAMPAGDYERTAIVLCNEQLLPVLINSLPQSLLRVNVTMGWPLKFTKANDFFNSLIDLNIAFSRNKNFLQNELVVQFVAATNSFLNTKVVVESAISLRSELIALFENTDVHSILVSSSRSVINFIHSVIHYIDVTLELNKTQQIDSEILAHYKEVFNKLLLLPGFEEHIHSWYLFKQLFNKFTRNYPLAFVGEPLAGIQVMGMLETRALDFDNVFILSANEGYLPAQNVYAGYIPYDLRAHFKLPGKTEQDAVFAYYFYRLLQRGKNIHVFYNAQNELLQQAERSRYLLQIEKELNDINPLIEMRSVTVDAQLDRIADHFHVRKSAYYFDKLGQLMESGFSATMLLTYCKCPLDFYHKYILGFKQPKELFQLDDSGIGNMVHYFFNHIFSKIVGQKITSDFFSVELNNANATLEIIAKEKFNSFNFNSGQNYLALQLVKKMVTSFLEKQKNNSTENIFIGKTLAGTELERETSITVDGHGFKLRGSLDLLLCDDADNYFVFDFKTGRVMEESLRLSEQSTLTLDLFSVKDKLMQLLIYKKLIQDNYKTNSIQSYIIPLATGSGKLMAIETSNLTENDILKSFFETSVLEMLNKEIEIIHNEKSIYCEFCD